MSMGSSEIDLVGHSFCFLLNQGHFVNMKHERYFECNMPMAFAEIVFLFNFNPLHSSQSRHVSGSPERKRRIGVIPETMTTTPTTTTPQHSAPLSSSSQSHPSTSSLNPTIPKVASNVESQVGFYFL